MTGFELRISGIGSDRSANWATTTATHLHIVMFFMFVYSSTGASKGNLQLLQ